MSLEKPGAFNLPYSQRYKRSSPFDFPKFVLTKKDEKGVIMVIDPEPTCAFVHWIITGTRVDGKTNTVALSGAYFICHGKPEVLLREESDPESCTLCKNAEDAEDTDDAPIGTARFKACTHIIHYATTPMGQFSTAAGQPPMFQLKVWVFGQQVYNILADKKDLWGQHTYRHHDLIVTCISTRYKNYNIELMPGAVWLDAKFTQFGGDKRPKSGLALSVTSLYKQAKLKELGPVLGRSLSVEEIDKVVDKARSVVSESVVGQGQTPQQVETAVNVGVGAVDANKPAQVDIDDLFGDTSSSPVEPTTEPTKEPPVDEPASPLPQADVSTQQPVEKVADDAELDFDALLAS